jgi:hypothetical protein
MYTVGEVDKLSVIAVDGSHLVQLPWSGTFVGFAVWEADGKSLYVSGSQGGDKFGDSKIWRADANGASVTQIAEKCGGAVDISPDRRYLLGGILWGERTGIYQFSISDKKCTLLKGGIATYFARFAPDGKSFVYSFTSRGETNVYRQPWQNGTMMGPEKIVLKFPSALRADYAGNAYDISRDLSTVVYARPAGHADLYLLSQK